MSSILTNTSAMVALQTLKSVNSNLQQTQSEISTGKSVASARDNAAVWAISKTMESDVKGFTSISESLSLGESTVATARAAAETITDLLTDIKGKIVNAQEENVSREKIQSDIDALTGQISSVANAAQFNGLNLVKGTEAVNVLSSLDRSSDGSVSASDITVNRQDLTFDAGSAGSDALTGGLTAASFGTINGATASDFTSDADGFMAELTFSAVAGGGPESFTVNVDGNVITSEFAASTVANDVRDFFVERVNALGLEGVTASVSGAGTLEIANTNAFEGISVTTDSTVDGSLEITDVNGAAPAAPFDADNVVIDQRAATLDFVNTTSVSEGDTFLVTAGGGSSFYVAGRGETMEDVAKGLKAAIDGNAIEGIKTEVQFDDATDTWQLAVDDADGDGTATTFSLAVTTGGEASGGLLGLDKIDVTTDDGANAALGNIETMIQNSIDSAAAFGSVQGRIDTQSDFIGKLMDSLKTGIGTLVDADLEETSARLQALQVQQQLATQSLSIANQAPQNILALFR